MYQIRQETPEDWHEVEYLFDTAFAPGRSALSSYRLRDGVDPVPALCLVARDSDGVLAGAVRNWPVVIGEDATPALLLGPIAVHPTRQGEGLGAILMAAALDAGVENGWERIMLIGDEPYYRRFGFRRLDGVEFPPPTNPERILGQMLTKQPSTGFAGLVRKWPADRSA